jgi:hypothetical protein
MKVLQRLQPWQTTLLRRPLPTETTLFRQLGTISGIIGEGETGIEVVEAVAEAEEDSRGAEGKASAPPRAQRIALRSAIWAGTSGGMQSGNPFSCVTN